ncbi:UDP-glucuronosyltransferase 2a1-like [Plakobranchus ocellatus]|uniref:UDP-glucuronosyltransferase 2a1-like n=1 Tax=Plakobranchus ocellatus TaxID=259542 RepID=A0AAV3ZQ97_9GAST|nr:UDP-glucuronosyltransferase 2a1-like [Plakobranchus ocellatus]
MLREQTSSTKCSPTWAKTSTGEAKEPVENGRRQCVGFGALQELASVISTAEGETHPSSTSSTVFTTEANKRRSLVRTIWKRQATFLGHVMRRGKLEHLVTTGKFEGKRSRGRQREKIMDGLATWLGPGKVSDILAAVKDRDLWRDMIANAYKQGTFLMIMTRY